MRDLRDASVDVYLTRVKHRVYQLLAAMSLEAEIGENHFHDWNQHALEHLWNQMEPDHRAQSPLNVGTPDSSANVGPR